MKNKISILTMAILSLFINALYATPLYIQTARVDPQVIMVGVTPSIIDVGDTSFDILALVRPGLYALQDVTVGQGGGTFNASMTHVSTLSNGDQIWKQTFDFARGNFGTNDVPISFGSGSSQYFISVTDINQQSVADYNFPLLNFGNFPAESPYIDSSVPSNISYNTTQRNLPQVIMAGVTPSIVDILDTSFDVLTLVRPGKLPISYVTLTQSGNSLFSYAMQLRAVLGNGDQLWGLNYGFPEDNFGIQTLHIAWGTAPGQYSIQVVDTAQQTSPPYPVLRSGAYPAINTTSTTTTCASPQVLQNGVCVTPTTTCTSPQVLQNGVCVTPTTTCTSPQVLQNGVCVTPTTTCTSAQVLQNGVCVTPGTYTLGSTGPAGGIVFYVDSTGSHGYEVQPFDYIKNGNSDFTWQQAMTAAQSYGANWHLPTVAELNTLFTNKQVVGSSTFSTTSYYWSSEQVVGISNPTYAYALQFCCGNAGSTEDYPESDMNLVRAVSEF